MGRMEAVELDTCSCPNRAPWCLSGVLPARSRLGHGPAEGRGRDAPAPVPQAADLLEDAAEDLLAHLHFPREHRRRLHSTNPLERLHKEIKRRTNVVGIFPNRASLVRMVTTLLQEQDDEWQVADRRYFSAGSMSHIDVLGGGETPRELLAAIA
jgi:hypothetical protein